MTKDQAEFYATLTIMVPALLFAGGAYLWNKSAEEVVSRQRTEIVEIASDPAIAEKLRLGQIIKIQDVACSGDNSCLQGTILALPTKDACGVVFAGKPDELPTGTIRVIKNIKSMATKEVPNPSMLAFCPRPLSRSGP